MQRRIEMMMTVREQTATARPETGPARAVSPEDWAGIFIRAGDAERFLDSVSRACDSIEAEWGLNPINAPLEELRDLLADALEALCDVEGAPRELEG